MKRMLWVPVWAVALAACSDAAGPKERVTWASLSAGGTYTCGLTTGSDVYCWGGDLYGQLGDGRTNTVSPAPVAAATGIRLVSVTAGAEHTCGLTASGAAYCWGFGFYGQLGNNTSDYAPSPRPVVVAGGLTFEMMVAGDRYTCALTGSGKAYCWGYNSDGEVGDSSQSVGREAPVPVAGGLTFTSLSAGGHACGLTAGGAAYCWGFNASGELGDGTMPTRTAPVAVAGGLKFASLTAGSFHTCGLTSGGVAYCWGANWAGQLGINTSDRCDTPGLSTACAKVPAPVARELTFTNLAAGDSHTCGVTSSGAVYCWGRNLSGQVGDGTTTDRATPVAVAGGMVFVQLTAAGDHTCGLTSAGAAYCWGYNGSGELGEGSTTDRHTPTALSLNP